MTLKIPVNTSATELPQWIRKCANAVNDMGNSIAGFVGRLMSLEAFQTTATGDITTLQSRATSLETRVTALETPTAYTVGALPSAAPSGKRAFVSDALAPAFGATVAGSGSIYTPVYSDGTNWRVG